MAERTRRRADPGWSAALLVDAVLGLVALGSVFGFAALALGAGVGPKGVAAMVLAVAAAAGRLMRRVAVRGGRAEVGASRCNERPPSRDR
ncbi:hypothetical protein [Dactylosporangium sp. NPDC051484]|uniref:hypothetical protein n=1 Tax=Dactylosporangium sp. NPDC051484 TaxID=3154942 RepID=UPI0034505350